MASPRVSAGASLLSFSLCLRSVLEFHSVLSMTRCSFWKRTRRIGPKTSCLEFPRYFTLFGSRDGSESCETQPNCGIVVTIATAPLSSLFFRFEGESSFRAFYLVGLQSRSSGTDTWSLLCIPIHFYRIDIREDANTHKVISYKYPFQ